MKQFYLFIARKQKFIKKLFFLSYIILIASMFFGTVFYDSSQPMRILYRSIAEKSGVGAVLLLIVSLIPGMLKRIGILNILESLFLLFRRQFGIVAFYLAANHLMYMSWISMIAKGNNPLPEIFTYQQAGFTALTIFLLLWVTSNNFSMKLLGQWWKYLQRLSYFSIIALIIHIFAAGSKLWMVLSLVLAAEAFSWAVYLMKKKK